LLFILGNRSTDKEKEVREERDHRRVKWQQQQEEEEEEEEEDKGVCDLLAVTVISHPLDAYYHKLF